MSVDVTTDISNAVVPMQNHCTKPGWTLGERVCKFEGLDVWFSSL
jgi:hypothetical protein